MEAYILLHSERVWLETVIHREAWLGILDLWNIGRLHEAKRCARLDRLVGLAKERLECLILLLALVDIHVGK